MKFKTGENIRKEIELMLRKGVGKRPKRMQW